MNITFVFQGAFADSMKTADGNPLTWTPKHDSRHLILVQTTVCGTPGDHTRGASIDLVDQNGVTVLDPASNPKDSSGPQIAWAKSDVSGPMTVPMMCLKWVAPSTWVEGATVAVTINNNGEYANLTQDSDNLCVIVVEVDQLPDR